MNNVPSNYFISDSKFSNDQNNLLYETANLTASKVNPNIIDSDLSSESSKSRDISSYFYAKFLNNIEGVETMFQSTSPLILPIW